MNMKKLKMITGRGYKNFLALVFLAAIFYIAAISLPLTLIDIGSNLLKTRNTDVVSMRNYIDDAYRNMLEFKGNYLINKGSYINLNGLMARVMGQRYVNARVKLDNGHLTDLRGKHDVTLAAAQMTKLYNRQKENGKHFLFVLAPHQVPKYEDILPVGYSNYSNQNADDMLDRLRAGDVPVLDLRDELIKDGISYNDAFFVTDHHWKPETGFWAYAKIVDYLINNGILMPIESKYTDINEFNTKIYSDWFLGTLGKRTGSLYAGVDDFAVITPTFETKISLEIPSASIKKNGNFADIAFDGSEKKKDYFNENPNGAYGHGDKDHKRYQNEEAPTDLKILTIGDSFKDTTATFFSLVAHTCDELDMRYYKGDFAEYYLEFNPDIIIILVNAGDVAANTITYDFFGDLQ